VHTAGCILEHTAGIERKREKKGYQALRSLIGVEFILPLIIFTLGQLA
jgi:hypothetical protein